MSKTIIITRRVTTPFLQSIPPQIDHFDAYIYAVVDRKKDKVINSLYGNKVRLDPCVFDWVKKTITIHIPLNINDGISSIDDLEPTFYESIEVAFLSLMKNCVK